MNHQPRTIILSGYGLNCEDETKFAFELAGGAADIIHLNDLIDRKSLLGRYQILAIPGGFSYGDDTGSGNAYALKIRNNLWEALVKFVARDTLTIGICNGFQILINLGLLPALEKKYGVREAALLHNDTGRFMNRWVDVEVANDSPWLRGIVKMSLPIAHGEGKLYVTDEVLTELKIENQIALRYCQGEMSDFQSLPVNPTGTIENICGLTDTTKRILGLMPHPERAVFFTQLPHWTFVREKCVRSMNKFPDYGPGIPVFMNAVRYFQ